MAEGGELKTAWDSEGREKRSPWHTKPQGLSSCQPSQVLFPPRSGE